MEIEILVFSKFISKGINIYIIYHVLYFMTSLLSAKGARGEDVYDLLLQNGAARCIKTV